VRLFDRSGKEVTPSTNRRYVQALKVVKLGGRWKVSKAVTTKANGFKGQPCKA
jgi:hypothetical protein